MGDNRSMSSPKHEPSPTEIAAKCDAIRAGWSPSELERRDCFAQAKVVIIPEATEGNDAIEFREVPKSPF